LLLLLFLNLLLSEPVHELVRVCKQLRDKIVLVVVLQVVDLLQSLVVRVRSLLYVRHEGFMLEVQSPVLLEVINLFALVDWFLLQSDRSRDLDWGLRVPLRAVS
jgi:hypothetical protein